MTAVSQRMESVEAELCFPLLLNSSCRKPQSHTSETVPVYAVLFLLSLLTIALNLLVIISIAHFRQLHSSTNFILLSLAVSDFFIGLVVIPVETLLWNHCWVLGDILCTLYIMCVTTFIMASVINMVLISVDRYVAICYPMHYQTRMTVRVIRINISVCWMYAVFYSGVIFHENFYNLGKYKSCDGECLVHLPVEADLILRLFIPISIIVVLYSRVFVVAVSQARAMRSQVKTSTRQTVMTNKSEIKAARNLGVLVLMFLMLYCPYYIVMLSANDKVSASLEFVMAFMVYVNSFFNPLLYALFYSWFRKAVKIIFTLQILSPGSCDFMLT